MYSFGATSEKSLTGIHPDLVKVMRTAIVDSPVDFTITDGVRTTAQQQALYAKGRTVAGEIVTQADGVHNKSNHQVKADGYGHAVDLYPYVNGAVSYDEYQAQGQIAAHIKATAATLGIHVVWGGDWTMAVEHIVDRPHFELK